MKYPALCLVAMITTVATGCDDTAEGIEKDAADTTLHIEKSAAKAETEVNREMSEFRRESSEALKEMDRKLERLERSVKAASGAAKAQTEAQLTELRQERDDLARKIDRAQAKTVVEWNETEHELDQHMAQLGKDINQALDKAGDKTEEALR